MLGVDQTSTFLKADLQLVEAISALLALSGTSTGLQSRAHPAPCTRHSSIYPCIHDILDQAHVHVKVTHSTHMSECQPGRSSECQQNILAD